MADYHEHAADHDHVFLPEQPVGKKARPGSARNKSGRRKRLRASAELIIHCSQ
jgi:hypothetical protein